MKHNKIALIGCGPSGMAVLSAFDESKKNGDSVPDIVCFEKQSEPTGLWNVTWRTGVDEHGEPVHNSMYRYLWSNGPKECLEMSNYTFDEHFKKPIPSFPPRVVLRDYLIGRFNKIKQKDIRYNTVVRNVEERDGCFYVTYEDLISNERSVDIFDYVIVATGHFSTPNVPSFNGLGSFPGRIIHSHDFRNAEEFKDQTILLIGSSYSAEDIALQCHKYGAKKCIVSCRTNFMNFKWPCQVTEVPGISHFDGNTCHFVNGSSHEVDAIITCTGYRHHYPFMDNNLKLRDATNILYPNHLYKGVFFENNTKVMYIGMQDQYFTYTLFDSQAWYARDVILGKISLPSITAMKEDIEKWYDRCQSLKSQVEDIDFQTDYIQDLRKETNYCSEEIHPKMANMFKEWEHHKMENILTYREKCFPSAFTGTLAVPLPLPWMKCMDDTKEWFVNAMNGVSVQ